MRTKDKHPLSLPPSLQSNYHVGWESNLAAVWGQMSTGGGHSQLEEQMSIVGVPVMSKTSFINTERNIGEMWRAELLESMAEAGEY